MNRKIPKSLKSAGRAWLKEAIKELTFCSETEYQTAVLAAQCIDDMDMARDAMGTDGLVMTTQDGGKKMHPACAVLRDARQAFIACCQKLKIYGRNAEKEESDLDRIAKQKRAEMFG